MMHIIVPKQKEVTAGLEIFALKSRRLRNWQNLQLVAVWCVLVMVYLMSHKGNMKESIVLTWLAEAVIAGGSSCQAFLAILL